MFLEGHDHETNRPTYPQLMWGESLQSRIALNSAGICMAVQDDTYFRTGGWKYARVEELIDVAIQWCYRSAAIVRSSP